jgi:hypothetical protein
MQLFQVGPQLIVPRVWNSRRTPAALAVPGSRGARSGSLAELKTYERVCSAHRPHVTYLNDVFGGSSIYSCITGCSFLNRFLSSSSLSEKPTIFRAISNYSFLWCLSRRFHSRHQLEPKVTTPVSECPEILLEMHSVRSILE